MMKCVVERRAVGFGVAASACLFAALHLAVPRILSYSNGCVVAFGLAFLSGLIAITSP